MEKITYLLTYLLTHSLTYLLKRIATRPPLQLETLHLPPFLSLPRNFVLAHARALVEEGMERGSPQWAEPYNI